MKKLVVVLVMLVMGCVVFAQDVVETTEEVKSPQIGPAAPTNIEQVEQAPPVIRLVTLKYIYTITKQDLAKMSKKQVEKVMILTNFILTQKAWSKNYPLFLLMVEKYEKGLPKWIRSERVKK